MTRPRSQLVSLEATPYYHCISRCVRRAFLCGKDPYSGRNFNHRKPWLVERLARLADIFAIDVAAYAVMSNHYHLVLHIAPDRADTWSDKEVITRWTKLYKGPPVVRDYLTGLALDEIHMKLLKREIELMRSKLSSISRFMSCLNEYIARQANAEDKCTGRFWEGRFKSKALLDEQALLSCMAYVDLNPVRAGIARSITESNFTSGQSRLRETAARHTKTQRKKTLPRTPRLMPFAESICEDQAYAAIPFGLKDYLDILDWTGRAVRPDKNGFIPGQTPTLLKALGLNETQWLTLALEIQKESITMLSGLMTLDKIERKNNSSLAA
jgi:REP element-mobilizing transposase RayT